MPEHPTISLPERAKPGQFSRLAVCCAADFDDSRPAIQCQHWVPGWFGDEIPNAEECFNAATAITRQHEEKAMDELVDRLKYCDPNDEVRKASIREEMSLCQTKFTNLMDLQCSMWENHSVIVRDVVADGNCGVEMLMHLTESGAHFLTLEDTALRSEILPILQSYRNELKGFWQAVLMDPCWRHLWKNTCSGLTDLRKWAEENLKPAETTPKKRKFAEGLPFTPDRVQDSSVGLLKEKDPKADGIIIVPGAPAPTEKAARRKPTGKGLPPEQVVTLQACVLRSLGERGITYRSWLSEHRLFSKTIVFLAWSLQKMYTLLAVF